MRQLHRSDVLQLITDDLIDFIRTEVVAQSLALQMMHRDDTLSSWANSMYAEDLSKVADMKDHELEDWYNERFCLEDEDCIEIISDLDPTTED